MMPLFWKRVCLNTKPLLWKQTRVSWFEISQDESHAAHPLRAAGVLISVLSLVADQKDCFEMDYKIWRYSRSETDSLRLYIGLLYTVSQVLPCLWVSAWEDEACQGSPPWFGHAGVLTGWECWPAETKFIDFIISLGSVSGQKHPLPNCHRREFVFKWGWLFIDGDVQI